MNEYTFWIIICVIICITVVMLATILSASADTKNNEEADNNKLENEMCLKKIERDVDYMKDVIPVLIKTSSNNLMELIIAKKEGNKDDRK